MIKNIDGLFFRLKSDFDFTWLNKYGKVFRVFDDQDSGNICFGVGNAPNRYFIKFAGAETAEYSGTTGDAIERLNATVPVYEALRHKNLVNMISAGEIGGGFAVVFEWTDAVCMGRQYLNSFLKFKSLPVNIRLKVFADILDFHLYVARLGYVAIDFYDGGIMYDFDKQRTTICDIDFYTRAPYVNPIGRMWGSSRFMSPEEFELGARIDEVTNVFTMGATAFELLGSNLERIPEKWNASIALFNIATKATDPERELRYQTINDFSNEWKAASKITGGNVK